MGGQACVSYGAAEFSRDIDLVLLPDPDNLARLRNALTDLRAEPVAFPALDLDYLRRGHAVHFRCLDAGGIRLDLMSVLRGVAPFDDLWPRRTTVEIDGDPIELMGLPDLVSAKKTQRDKDWPMIRRLVEANYFAHRSDPTPEQIRFWLAELRTAALLTEVARRFPDLATEAVAVRPAVAAAIVGDEAAVERALTDEQVLIQALDRAYWIPLRSELERLRRNVSRPGADQGPAS